MLTDVKFLDFAKRSVVDYVNDHLDKSDPEHEIATDNVYVVWYCKTLQNWKALLSTTLPDGMYYKLTINGDANECYLDAYKKFENQKLFLSDYYI